MGCARRINPESGGQTLIPMQIHLLSVGTQMPAWLATGYQEFSSRLPSHCQLKLVEIPAVKRGKRPDPRAIEIEGDRLLTAIPKAARVVALDLAGQQWSTEQLTQQLANWLQSGQDVALLVGGADGLSQACKQRAQQTWAVSRLTFPHLLMRVLLAEQLYRAWSLLNHHPYHRATP